MLPALALAAILLHQPTVPTIQGMPLCVSTRWAEHHYHSAMTPRHTFCSIRIQTKGLPVSRGPASPDAFPVHGWYPASWETLGTITNYHGAPIALLIYRP